MGEYVPYKFPGDSFGLTASAAITGGQLVEVTGNMTGGPAGALSTKVVGVASNDAASGAAIALFREGIQWLTATGAIAAGDQVCCAAGGTVQTIGANSAFTVIGVALEAIANGASGRVSLRLS